MSQNKYDSAYKKSMNAIGVYKKAFWIYYDKDGPNQDYNDVKILADDSVRRAKKRDERKKKKEAKDDS